VATDTSIIIGIMDKKKTLNVFNIPLGGDSPKGIAHQEASKVIQSPKTNLISIFNFVYYYNYSLIV